MKTEVVIQDKDQYGEFEKGDMGYVDGYVRGGDNSPFAVVVLQTPDTRNGSFVLVSLNNLKKREYKK